MIILLLVFVIGGGIGYTYYKDIFNSNTAFEGESFDLYISSGSDLSDLIYNLDAEKVLKDLSAFKKTADLKKFESVKSGRYILEKGMSNQDIINKLRIGDQDPVNVTFNSVKKKRDLAGKLSRRLEVGQLANP